MQLFILPLSRGINPGCGSLTGGQGAVSLKARKWGGRVRSPSALSGVQFMRRIVFNAIIKNPYDVNAQINYILTRRAKAK